LPQVLPQVILELMAFLVNLVVMTFVFYVAGLIVVGKKRALPVDAFVISLLGTIISHVFIVFFPTLVEAGLLSRLIEGFGVIISLIGILFLIRYFYETGWLGSLAVAILATITLILLRIALALLLELPRLFLFLL